MADMTDSGRAGATLPQRRCKDGTVHALTRLSGWPGGTTNESETTMSRIEQLENRLERLEHEATRWRRAAVRARTGALALLLLGGAGIGLAAADAPVVGDMLVAERMEIVDADGNLVLALSGDERGGRLDIWTTGGQNVVRISTNDTGGDLNLWNGDGGTVFSAFAAEHGGEFGLWGKSGGRSMRVATGEHGGRLEMLGAEGQPGVTISNHATGGALEVAGGGQTVFSARSDASGSGTVSVAGADGGSYLSIDNSAGPALHLTDTTGRPRVSMRSEGHGGALSFTNDGGKPALTIGVADPSGGGFIDVANASGTRVFAAGADDDGCGRIDLSNSDGQRVFKVDGVPGLGADIAVFTARGKKALMLGSRPEGGLVNLFNRHEVPVVVAGYAETNMGGAMSIKNGRGLPVVHLATDELGHGHMTVYDVEGKRRRVVRTPR